MDDVEYLHLREFKIRPDSGPCGRGGFSEVWDAWHKKFERVAIKIFKEHNFTNEKFKEEILAQSKASKGCNGVLIRGFISERVSPSMGPSCDVYGLVTEFMTCGTLDDFIHRYDTRIYSWCLAYRILHEISSAMNLLHQYSTDQRLLHFDLKPENILLNYDLHPKISDFGASLFSSVSNNTSPPPRRNGVHTFRYASPEFFINQQRGSSYDVYSFGIMMWEVLSTRHPYGDVDYETAIYQIRGGSYPPIDQILRDGNALLTTSVLKNLYMQCCSFDPNERPKFSEITKKLAELKVVGESEITEAVTSAKTRILQKMQKTSFDVQSSEYQQPLQDIFHSQPISSDLSYSSQQHGQEPVANIMQHPDGDLAPPSSLPVPPLGEFILTAQDCEDLGRKFHYSDGWEVFAMRIGLPHEAVENIKEDRHTAVERKIAVFREWSRLNDQRKDLLIKQLRENRCNMDCWEFLDPDGRIRRSLQS